MSAFSSVVSGSVQSVTFKSQLTPDFTYDPNAPSSPPSGGASWLMKLIKPAAYVVTPLGTVPVEPYGEPTENYVPLLALALVIPIALLLIVFVRR